MVKTLPRAKMPVDRDGNIADVVVCGSSRFSRMIPGSLYELFLSGAQRDIVRHHLKPILGWQDGMSEDRFIYSIDDSKITQAYNEYLEFLFLTSKSQYKHEKDADLQKQKEILYDICNDGLIYLNMKIDDEIDLQKTVPLIKNRFKITMGYFSMIDEDGKKIEVHDRDCQISYLYMILLDKTGDEWMAVSTSPMHAFGILTPVNRSSRHTSPWRVTAPRFLGETESRLLTANAGPLVVAELQSRANSIPTQQEAVWTILDSETPTNIAKLVDRNRTPLGGTKGVQLTKHMLNAFGVDFNWEPGMPLKGNE